MKNAILALLIVLLLAVGGYFLYQQSANAKKVSPDDAFKAADNAVFAQMKSIFQKADTGGAYGWMAPLIQDSYDNGGSLIAGKKSKVEAFTKTFYGGFYYFAEGAVRANEVNGGAGYLVGGGYNIKSLGDALYSLYTQFKNSQELSV